MHKSKGWECNYTFVSKYGTAISENIMDRIMDAMTDIADKNAIMVCGGYSPLDLDKCRNCKECDDSCRIRSKKNDRR